MKLKNEEVRTDHYVQDFLRSRGLKESSMENYVIRLKSYCEFLGKKPPDIINIAEKEQDNPKIKRRDRKIKQHLLDYVDHLKEQGKSRNTIKSNLDTIKAFYHEYDIETPILKNIFSNNNQNPSFEEIPSKEHVKQVLKVCSVRDQALILLHFSSGMGASEVRHLTYGDFLSAMDEYLDLDEYELLDIKKVVKKLQKQKNLIGTWKIRRFKTGMPYITFNTPESTQAILNYLLERERTHKIIKDLNDPLFVSHFNKIMSKQLHAASFREINERAGFGKRNPKRNFLTSHMLRKLFTTTLYKSKVDELPINWMLGHKINPITESYFKADVQSLKQHYLKALNALALERVEVKTVTTSEYDLLLKELRQKDKDYEKLEKRLELMEKLIATKEVREELNE